MKSLYLLPILLLASLATAQQDPQGTWIWYQTEWEPDVITTPEDEGYTMMWEFMSDGTLLDFRDNLLSRTGTYTYYLDEVIIPPDIYHIFYIIETDFDGETESYSYDISDNVLSMCWGSHPIVGLPWFPCFSFYREGTVASDTGGWATIKSRYR